MFQRINPHYLVRHGNGTVVVNHHVGDLHVFEVDAELYRDRSTEGVLVG